MGSAINQDKGSGRARPDATARVVCGTSEHGRPRRAGHRDRGGAGVGR